MTNVEVLKNQKQIRKGLYLNVEKQMKLSKRIHEKMKKSE